MQLCLHIDCSRIRSRSSDCYTLHWRQRLLKGLWRHVINKIECQILDGPVHRKTPGIKKDNKILTAQWHLGETQIIQESSATIWLSVRNIHCLQEVDISNLTNKTRKATHTIVSINCVCQNNSSDITKQILQCTNDILNI